MIRTECEVDDGRVLAIYVGGTPGISRVNMNDMRSLARDYDCKSVGTGGQNDNRIVGIADVLRSLIQAELGGTGRSVTDRIEKALMSARDRARDRS